MWRASGREVVQVGLTSCTCTSFGGSRPLTRAVSYHSQPHSRLVPHPPDLLKWVRREGGFVHPSITISDVPSCGLGLVASDDIPQASDLIALPPHLPLQFHDLNHESAPFTVLTHLASRIPEELWAMRLGLKLLQERAKSDSFWWPYISNLPHTYSVPIFFEGKDIQKLQYAPIVNQINKRCRFLLKFEDLVDEAVENLKPEDCPFGGQKIDSSALGWAMAAVSSRAFRLYGDNHSEIIGEYVPMMLPLIDMCNHSFCPNAKILQGRRSAENANILVKVVAEKHIKKDAPLELNYGDMNNDLFLLDYGFVTTPNPFEFIELRYHPSLLEAANVAVGINSPCFASPAAWQSEFLSALKLDDQDSWGSPNLKVTLGGPDLVDGRVLAASRILNASDVKPMCMPELSTLQSLSAEAPLGILNELAALRTIIGLCVLVLKNFPTHIVEDEALLKEGVSGLSEELAIRFRMEKKSAMMNVMKEMSKRVTVLQQQSEESPAAA